MKNIRKLAALLAATIFTLTLLTGCGGQTASSAGGASPAAQSTVETQTITATIRITDRDGSTTEVALTCTAGDTLASALCGAGIISQEEADAGFVTVVNGITADYNTDRAWWALVDANGEMTALGIAGIQPAEGDVYGLVYTNG